MSIQLQIVYLFLLAIPIACISWTITYEEVFREPREYCVRMYHESKILVVRKFFYLFTCEYCFSHYVTLAMLFITQYQLLYEGWRGYLIAGFSLVWIANLYMSLFAFLRTGLKKQKTIVEVVEKELEIENNVK